MKLDEIFEDKKTYTPPPISVGDTVMLGKFKNRKAEVTGFKTDANSQPELKTTKGTTKLFKPRIPKLAQISEGVSSILYQSTSIHNVKEILNRNAILLTPSIGTDSDYSINKNKTYFLSTARSRVGQYHYPASKYHTGQCLLVLDGQKLMQDGFTGAPVNYWGSEVIHTKNEMEDRIVSSKSEIPNAMKYIKEIHILLNTQEKRDDRLESMIRILRLIMIIGKSKAIPVFVYNNFEDFNVLRKDKANVDINFKNTEPKPKPFATWKRRNYFARYIELLKKSDRAQLSKDASQLLHRWYNKRDAIIQLKATIHNDKTGPGRENLVKFLNYMKELGLNSAEDVYDYINKKWNND